MAGARGALLLVIAGVSSLGLFVYTPLTLFAPASTAHHPHFPPPTVDVVVANPVFGASGPLVDIPPPSPPPLALPPPPLQQEELQKDSRPPPAPPTQGPPPLTLIVLFSPQPDRTSNYLPNFFASVAANPSLDVLLIKFDKYRVGGGACEAALVPPAVGARNVREVCVPMDEYYALHVDYLCAYWGCTGEERARTRALMEERMSADRVNSFFRPFRAEVFKKYLHPELKLWGWSDLDMMFGNFDRMFPWDVAHDFDVILAGWPVATQRILVFTPGHLTVFRNTPALPHLVLTHYPPLASFAAYASSPLPSEAPEEGELSHALLMKANVSFLRFDAMVESTHHVSALGRGVYALENAGWADHSLPDGASPVASQEDALVRLAPQIAAAVARHDHHHISSSSSSPLSRHAATGGGRAPTFSERGVEHEVVLRDDPAAHAGVFLWFPPEYAVTYDSALGGSQPSNGRDARRYVLRRDRGGPVVERFEPLDEGADRALVEPQAPRDGWTYDSGNRPWLREQLYNHFQVEKYRDWWALPERAMAPGEVLYVDKEHGAHLWDVHGATVWESPRKDSPQES